MGGTSRDMNESEGAPVPTGAVEAELTVEVAPTQKTDTVASSHRQAMNEIAQTGKTGWLHIMLYNSLLETQDTNQGIESFIDVHTNLMLLHGLMAGFQYVAFDPSADDLTSDVAKWVFGIRYVGLTLSLLGTVVSLISIEFLKSAKLEPTEFVVAAVLDYAAFFLLSDYLAVVASIILFTAVNLLLWEKLPAALCITFNALGFVGGALLFYQFWKMVLARQNFGIGRRLYSDPLFQEAIEDRRKDKLDFRTHLWGRA